MYPSDTDLSVRIAPTDASRGSSGDPDAPHVPSKDESVGPTSGRRRGHRDCAPHSASSAGALSCSSPTEISHGAPSAAPRDEMSSCRSPTAAQPATSTNCSS
eukprot:1063310-Prymnesium_polylepis.1